MTRLVIFDFDGTLFDTIQCVEHSVKLTFESLLPTHVPAPADIHSLISSGAGISDTLRALHPDTAVFNATEDQWVVRYRELYATHGQSLTKPYPGAERLLRYLKSENIPTAIVTNKGIAAVKTALEQNGLKEYVPEDLIVGDKTPGAKRKPDPASFANVLVPTLKARYGVEGLEDGEVLMVGDTVADIKFAANIGAKICWCRYGQGDHAECSALDPDFDVSSLGDLVEIIGREKGI